MDQFAHLILDFFISWGFPYHLMIVIIQVYWVPDQCHLWGEGQDELERWWGKEEADKGKKRENWRHSKKEGRTPTALGIGLPLFQSGVCLYVLFNFFDKNSWSFFLTWRYCIVMSGVKEATRSTLLSLPAGLQNVWIRPRVLHESGNSLKEIYVNLFGKV